jgi:hypothetical protein
MDSFKIEVLAGILTLKSDGTFENTGTSRTTSDGVVTTGTDTETGDYTLVDTTLTLTLVGLEEPPLPPLSGTLIDGRIEIASMVYEKV